VGPIFSDGGAQRFFGARFCGARFCGRCKHRRRIGFRIIDEAFAGF
jgi:hypothetical protein